MQTILEVKNIVKDFPEIRAVDNLSLSIKTGICFGLLGPNGAGKTTLIEIIEGILQANSGKILYKGKPRRSSFKNEVGIQFQSTELPQFLTVKETLETYRKLYNKNIPLNELVEMCQLQDICDRDNRKISGGQKQRLLLAIALANDPELIFLDEPTTGLDPQARRHLWDIVNKIKSENKTIILTTHYMEEAQILCDEVAIMDLGKIIAQGAPDDLLEDNSDSNLVTLHGDIDESKMKSLPLEYLKVHDRYEIRTDNIDECISQLIEKKVDLSSLTVRSQNLEDLFLKLTGKSLRD